MLPNLIGLSEGDLHEVQVLAVPAQVRQVASQTESASGSRISVVAPISFLATGFPSPVMMSIRNVSVVPAIAGLEIFPSSSPNYPDVGSLLNTLLNLIVVLP